MFKRDECIEKDRVWCGKKENNVSKLRKGSSYECFRKGYGAGMYNEIKKDLDKNDLRNIKYIGERYYKRFLKENVKNLNDILFVAKNFPHLLTKFLSKILKDKNGNIDKRAFNSVLLFIDDNNVKIIGRCL